MKENTPEERRNIAEEVNGRKSKSGKTTYPQFINSVDDIVAQFKEYAKQDILQRMEYDTLDADKQRLVMKSAEMYSDLATKSLEHDMPALIFFFRLYLTQR